MTNLIYLLLLLVACQAKSEKQARIVSFDNDKEVISFIYHRFGDGRYPSTNVSLEDFKAHLQYLKSNDFQVLTFSEAISYLQSDEPNQKTAVITIDDGYKSFYENGLPLLKQYDFPATLFINTETVGDADYMDWKSVKDAVNQGIEIGNHTHSHAYFLNKPEEQRYVNFKNEILQTQEIIEKHLGFTPEVFAYPFGEFDLKMTDIVEKLGFKGAAAQNSGVIYSGTDLMQCPRFPMSELYSDIDKFKSKALMNALKVMEKKPTSPLVGNTMNTPTLDIKFRKGNLQLSQLQCFIQGTECEIKQSIDGGTVTLQASPKSPINKKRRTLYTITVPDKDGKWHWFSHLWVNPVVK